jgi:mRNA interferase RelE/StbE
MTGPLCGAATQIYSRRFDQSLFALPTDIQLRIQRKLDEVGSRLRGFPHYRMEGEDAYRLRIGDYRVIYQIEFARNELILIALGHRREIYKKI